MRVSLLLLLPLLLQSVAVISADSVICRKCDCSASTGLLDCSNRELENHFPDYDAWASLGFDVKEARFDYNLLVHLLPWPILDSLERLSMSHNHIAKIEYLAFMNLSSIVEIDLSHNHLTSDVLSPHIFQGHFAPENYEPLEKMRTLRLGSNALHTLNQDLFMHLPHLEELYLDSNPFTVIDRNTHVAISSIPFLKVLDLSRTMISALPEYFLHTPKYLERFNLAGNNFLEPPPGLADSHQLLYLDLSENPFSVISSIAKLPNLTTLVMSHHPNLTEVRCGALAGLPSLSALIMHSNPRLSQLHAMALAAPPVPPAEVHVWPPIRKLDLHDNGLGYLESTLVGRWDQVEELRLDGNRWVCDCDNQWLIDTLLPTVERTRTLHSSASGASSAGTAGTTLLCSEPVEMRGKELRALQRQHYHMRCLDAYGNRPERDAALLVAVLVGALVAVPATLAVMLAWRRCGPVGSHAGLGLGLLLRVRRGRGRGAGAGAGGRGAADYSRAFYKPADTEPDYI